MILNTTETCTSKSGNMLIKESTAAALSRGQQEYINLFTVVNFVEQAIQTLSKYKEQLKT